MHYVANKSLSHTGGACHATITVDQIHVRVLLCALRMQRMSVSLCYISNKASSFNSSTGAGGGGAGVASAPPKF